MVLQIYSIESGSAFQPTALPLLLSCERWPAASAAKAKPSQRSIRNKRCVGDEFPERSLFPSVFSGQDTMPAMDYSWAPNKNEENGQGPSIRNWWCVSNQDPILQSHIDSIRFSSNNKKVYFLKVRTGSPELSKELSICFVIIQSERITD